MQVPATLFYKYALPLLGMLRGGGGGGEGGEGDAAGTSADMDDHCLHPTALVEHTFDAD